MCPRDKSSNFNIKTRVIHLPPYLFKKKEKHYHLNNHYAIIIGVLQSIPTKTLIIILITIVSINLIHDINHKYTKYKEENHREKTRVDEVHGGWVVGEVEEIYGHKELFDSQLLLSCRWLATTWGTLFPILLKLIIFFSLLRKISQVKNYVV